MRNLSKVEDREEMSEVIQGLFLSLNPIVSWDVAPDLTRKIHPVKISDVSNDEDSLTFTLDQQPNFEFTEKIVFFYSEEQKIIFKSEIKQVEAGTLIVNIPSEIKKLDDKDNAAMAEMIALFNTEINFSKEDALSLSLDDDDDPISPDEGSLEPDWFVKSMSDHDANLFSTELSSITLDEEDKIFEGVRSAPRAKPPEGKMVTLQIHDESRPQSTYTLYDLSQGGLSFLVFSKGEFNVGERLLIKAFDTNRFEAPMITEVKAIREADDMGIQYKVGCQFDESEG